MSAGMDERVVASLFTVPISACVADAEMFSAPLFLEEEAYISKAVPARRREYAAGRAAARKALARAGAALAPIVARPDRSPGWPADFCGSITHCAGFCSAVVARADDAAGVGFDAEEAKPLGADLHHLVCRPNDLEHFRDLPRIDGLDWPKLAFSAKESFYKCHYPIYRQFLGFRDASVCFAVDPADPRQGTFSVLLEKNAVPAAVDFAGRWLVDDERVYTGVTLPRC